MFLRHRLMRLTDVEECFRCSRDRHLYSPDERDALLHLWSDLIQQSAALHTVIDEERPDGTRRVAYFCMCVPITDSFIADAVAGKQPPSLSLTVLRAWQEGASPLLAKPRIAAANSGSGLKVFVLQSGWPADLSLIEYQSVVEKIAQWIPFVNAGYHLTELLIEAYNEWEIGWSASAGFSQRIDYAEQGWSVPDGRRNCLFGLNRAEAAERVGSPFAGLFKDVLPRFSFSEGEQELLLHALSDETDASIAQIACISPETVKKRWQSVFERIEQVAPELLPSLPAHLTGAVRGREKRTRVLAYLRHHMEELRPYLCL